MVSEYVSMVSARRTQGLDAAVRDALRQAGIVQAELYEMGRGDLPVRVRMEVPDVTEYLVDPRLRWCFELRLDPPAAVPVQDIPARVHDAAVYRVPVVRREPTFRLAASPQDLLTSEELASVQKLLDGSRFQREPAGVTCGVLERLRAGEGGEPVWEHPRGGAFAFGEFAFLARDAGTADRMVTLLAALPRLLTENARLRRESEALRDTVRRAISYLDNNEDWSTREARTHLMNMKIDFDGVVEMVPFYEVEK